MLRATALEVAHPVGEPGSGAAPSVHAAVRVAAFTGDMTVHGSDDARLRVVRARTHRSPRLPPLRAHVAHRLGRLAEVTSRATGRGSGSVIGGRVMLAVAPDSARVLVEGRDVVLVTGTNGKTTTTAYVTAALRTRAIVDTNHTGANPPAGLVSTLASGSASRVVLECDEAWLPWALSQTAPRTIVFLNVSRDQLHRHHEVAALASLWRPALAGVDHVVANVDDPAVVFAALAARRQTWVAAGTGWTQDALVCPRCGDECRWSDEAWACRCGLHRPSPHWWLEGGCVVSATTRLHLDVALPGRANRVNAAMALATTAALGTSPHEAVAAMRDIGSVAGRYHVF